MFLRESKIFTKKFLLLFSLLTSPSSVEMFIVKDCIPASRHENVVGKSIEKSSWFIVISLLKMFFPLCVRFIFTFSFFAFLAFMLISNGQISSIYEISLNLIEEMLTSFLLFVSPSAIV
jgi:hypothetical protein